MNSKLNKPDTRADKTIKSCLEAKTPKNFVMIAGAGSGKTTSLVKALHYAISSRRNSFRKNNQQIACITYTEIAAKQIWNDVANDKQAVVSTIHSFLWQIISPFQRDIKEWATTRLHEKHEKLLEKQSKYGPRVQQRTKDKDQSEIEDIKEKLRFISEVPHFNYGTGSDYLRGILGHDDIIKMVPQLIEKRDTLKIIIAQKYPIIFVDESQDTIPDVVSALKSIANLVPKFCIGFFGDPMQKIYLTGIGEIAINEDWEKITKPENFRSSKAVLGVINAIRLAGDGLEQNTGKPEAEVIPGCAKIFILPADDKRTERLSQVQKFLSQATGDKDWETENIKLLVIVHRMAATRLGFPDLFAALNDGSPSELKNGIQDGTAWPLKPFLKFVLPLIIAFRAKNDFDVISFLRANCPLLAREVIQGTKLDKVLASLKENLITLNDMMEKGTVGEVIAFLQKKGIYQFDEKFEEFLAKGETAVLGDEANSRELLVNSMGLFMKCSAKQFLGYKKYIDDESPFSTQHGTKGAEFDRVLTVLDDDEGNYNLFSYDKYFGVKELSDTDIERIGTGEESTLDRTRRLFYVCCSRAIKDLGVVYFVNDPLVAVQKVREKNIFPIGSIHTLQDLI